MKLRLILTLALVVAACGGGGDSGDGDDPEGDGGGGATSIDVVATEFAFDPDLYLVEAESEIDFSMTNEGSVEHNWVLLAEGVNVTSETDVSAGDILAEFAALAGETAAGTFTAPAPGTYQVVCTIAGHLEAGMVGELAAS